MRYPGTLTMQITRTAVTRERIFVTFVSFVVDCRYPIEHADGSR